MNLQTGSGRRLTASEAETLWRKWSAGGDAEARDRSSCRTRPMVNYLASRKARSIPAHCEVDDLVSCGLMALVAASTASIPPGAPRSSSSRGRG